jgi:Protein of unknown function (DUF3106)
MCALLLAVLLGAPGLAQNPPADQKSATPVPAAPQAAAPARHSSRDSGAWLRKYKDMPPAEQEKALANDPYFRHLPAAHQQKLRQQLQKFNSLPPDKKESVVRHMQVFGQLTPAQRQSARELHAKLNNIPPDRRKIMRSELRQLRQMPPDDRQRELNSDTLHASFNDNEREILKGLADLPIGAPAKPPAPAQPAPASPSAPK